MSIIKKKLFCVILTLFSCSSYDGKFPLLGQAYLCISAERENGKLLPIQNEFHRVTLISGQVIVHFNRKENDCYYFDNLPVNKIFSPYYVENLEISGNTFQWKNDGSISRGVYGKFNSENSPKIEVQNGKPIFFGKYKLIVSYSDEDYSYQMAPMNMKRGNDPRTRTMKLINAEYRVINTEK